MKDKNKSLSINSGKLERVEQSEDLKKMVLRGYAVVFDDKYEYIDHYTGENWTERVDKNAFEGVDTSNVLMLRDHDYSRVLGREGKNLRLEVDEKGLFFEVELPNTELARETFELAESEICDQCSFGFSISDYETDKVNKIETITKIAKLFEITITPIPAYKSTVVVTMAENREKRTGDEIDLQEQKLSLLRKKIGVK